MVLVVSNTQDATASFLIPLLDQAGIEVLRFDTDNIVPHLSVEYRTGQAEIKIDNRLLKPSMINHIWYRRPEQLVSPLFNDSPEGDYARLEWTEFLECFLAHIPPSNWMNHPSRNTLASRKLEQLSTASKLGFLVPETLATQEASKLQSFFRQHDSQVIVKPMSTGYVERPDEVSDTLIYTNQVLESHLVDLSSLKNCPTLFQQFIQKESDIRITVVDEEVHAVELKALDLSGKQRCDIRRNNMADVSYENITLPSSIKEKILRLMQHYKLRFGAIDMAITTDGQWIFFEINPNGQWAWLDQLADASIANSFVRAFSKPSFVI